MGRHALFSLSLLASASAAAAGLCPATAEACGGTFCDAGPQLMPVDQTSENVLFVMDEGTVEAHVQIQYTGEPEEFAWVVPVMARPEIEPGSDLLFRNLLVSTRPTSFVSVESEDCGAGGGLDFGCSSTLDARADDASAGSGSSDGFDDDDPTLLETGVAGAFEYAVLEGGTTEGVVQWLDDNGFAQDDEAPELLDGYLSKGFMFVAFKLRGGAGVDEIHPVVLRYEGDEPCVPIRLTRIAASDDMGVRTFFLGESRFVSSNYRDVELNPMALALAWGGVPSNYEEVVTRAVDAAGSDGHGFVTEYAGPSSIVSWLGLVSPAWESSRFVETAPLAAIAELQVQGLLSCVGGRCSSNHPLIPGLLESFIPRPAGVAFDEFYACINCYEYDESAWSGVEFAEALEERVFAPAEHAADLLETHSYLSRLYTTISPHEMTADPVFHANPDLPDISNLLMATYVVTCNGDDYLEFEDGQRLAIGPVGDPPSDMPAALRISEIPASGPPMELMNFAAEIDEVRNDWNADYELDADGEDGCNCRARKRGADGVVWSVLLLSMGWIARRRRTN